MPRPRVRLLPRRARRPRRVVVVLPRAVPLSPFRDTPRRAHRPLGPHRHHTPPRRRAQPDERAPGRRRRADTAEPLSVFVDYAHTDDALSRALAALRPLVPAGASLRVIFGCGGDRDRTKRPRMAAAAEKLADHLVITSDNPRTEDPQSIIDMVVEGLSPRARARALTDPDRERAINAVIASAHEGDIVLIAGKGHEDYQILPDGHGGTVRRHFDDRLVALDALHQRFSHTHAPRTAHA